MNHLHPQQNSGYKPPPQHGQASAPASPQHAPAQYQGPPTQVAPISGPAHPQGQPQQQAPPADRFAHICHLPMFPLLGDKGQAAVTDLQATSADAMARVQPGVLHRKKANRMWKTISATGTLVTVTFVTGVITRWAVVDPATGSTIIVDAYEGRGNQSWMVKTIWLVSNANARIRVRGKWDVKVQTGKIWTKDLNTKPLESVTLLTEVGGVQSEIEFEIVQRQERPVAPVETPHIKDRFKTWVVPA